VLRQSSTTSNGAGRATAGEGTKQAHSSGRKATEVTAGNASKAAEEIGASAKKTKVEVQYGKQLEDSMRHMVALENAVQGADNIKIDVENSTKALGLVLREFHTAAKALGLVRSPEAMEQRIPNNQQVLNQQQQKMLVVLKEICDTQKQ